MTDNDLLMQWVEQRDPEAFREMVNRHAGMVYGTCRRIIHDAVEAEDVAQECFEALAKAGTRPGAYLGAWLHRVATNRSLQHLRGDTRRRVRETACVPAESTDDFAEWQEAYALVDEALNALPERLRAPLVLYYLENQTQESIAATLGVARSTVPYRIGKGLERVRKSLRKRGVTLTSAALTALGVSAKASALPPALTASLGKLALAGSELLPAATVGTGFLGGLLSLKGALTVSMVVVLGLAGYETVQHKKAAPAPTIAQSSPSQSVAQEVPKDSPPAASVSGASPSTEAQTESSAAAPAPGTVNVTGELRMEGSNTPCKSLSLVFKSDATGKELHAHTETTGRFELRDVAPGDYHVFLDDTVRVLKDMPVTVKVPADRAASEVRLTVDAGASVSGRITDKETGIAVPGAGIYVAAVKDGQNAVSGCPENNAYTDRDGKYLFEGLRPGKYRLFLEPEITVCDAKGNPQYSMKLNGSESSDFAVAGRERLENIDFPLLLGGAPLSGMVRDADGRPAAGVRVEAATRRDRQEAETKKDGTFILRGLAAGPDCRVFARTDKEASEFIGPLTVPEAGLKDIQVQLRPGGVIRGTLTDDQGIPLAGDTLNAMSGLNVGIGCAVTDKDGAFEFAALPEGSYEIVLIQQARGAFVGPNTLAKVDVKWGKVTGNVALVYKSSAAAGALQIAGRVTDTSGQPVPGVTVSAQYSDMGVSKNAGKPSWTDGDGRYQITGLEQRAYMVLARSDSCISSRLQDIDPGASNADFVMKPRITIEGRVVRADNGQPVTQFEITPPNENPVQLADADGRFRLDKVDAENACRVTVKAAGFMKAEEHIELTPAKDAKDVVIRLDRAAGLTGRVLNTDGQPVSGAQIFATGGMERVQFNDESAVLARSDKDGTFQIATLPAERGFVAANHTEYAVGSAPYKPGVASVDIVLRPGGTVTGTVTSAGVPAGGVSIALGGLSLSLKQYNVPFSAKTGPDGTFQFQQVPSGEANIAAVFDKDMKDPLNMRSISKRVTVENGQTVSVALDLPEATAGIEGQVRLGGQPAPASAFVMFTCTRDGAESPSMAQADANGFFKFDAVPAGPGTLRASVPGSVMGLVRTVSAQVETVAGQVIRQDLDTTDTGVIVADLRGVTPSPGIVVTVSVFPGDAPVSAADTLLSLHVTGKSVAGAVAKNDGPLRFDMLPPGTYTVAALMNEFSEKTMHMIGMASGVVKVENGTEAAVELALQPMEE